MCLRRGLNPLSSAPRGDLQSCNGTNKETRKTKLRRNRNSNKQIKSPGFSSPSLPFLAFRRLSSSSVLICCALASRAFHSFCLAFWQRRRRLSLSAFDALDRARRSSRHTPRLGRCNWFRGRDTRSRDAVHCAYPKFRKCRSVCCHYRYQLFWPFPLVLLPHVSHQHSDTLPAVVVEDVRITKPQASDLKGY